MTLLAPLSLLFLLSIPVVVVFYLLRVRLRQLEVSSTYLWERLLRDLAAQDPWQKPRFTILMLVQILILSLLAFALARPAWLASAEESVFEVIVIDSSASMQAVDVAPSRFAEAKRQAFAAIKQLPKGSSITVIAATNRPEVLVPATSDPGEAVAGLEAAQPSSTALDMDAALQLASAVAAGHAKGRVDVFTDGAFAPPQDLPTQSVATRYHLVRGGDDNRAITAIAARADPQNSRRFQVFVRVQNFASRPASVTLGLYADGTLLDSRKLELAGSSSQDIVFDRLPEETNVVQARLLEPDALAVDNSAATVIERPHVTKVLMVSDGNIFLQRALALLPNVELYKVPPSGYSTIDLEQFDLIAFDGYLPGKIPRQNLLVVNLPDSPLMPVEGTLEHPTISAWESENPLLQFTSFNDVRVQQATKVVAPGWAKTLVEADGYPLLMAGETNGQRMLIMTFALQQSNLPLSAAFPIFIANAVGYLEPAGVLSDRNVAAGSALTIQPLRQAESLLVTQPDGSRVELAPAKALRYDKTDQVGVYTVEQKAAGNTISTERFAVNLADARESDIRPRIQGDTLGQSANSDTKLVSGQHEVWPWFVLAGLGLLTGEWWWYHRRA